MFQCLGILVFKEIRVGEEMRVHSKSVILAMASPQVMTLQIVVHSSLLVLLVTIIDNQLQYSPIKGLLRVSYLHCSC